MKSTLVWAVFLIFVVLPSYGVIVDKSFKVKGVLREFATFGFEQGGTISINATLKPVDQLHSFLIVYVCTAADFNKLVNEEGSETSETVCGDHSTCELVANATDPELALYSVKRNDLYHLLIINCRGNEAEVLISPSLCLSHYRLSSAIPS
jgi:hypothetical protein